jgi:mono/diheme cytochrome c family protein
MKKTRILFFITISIFLLACGMHGQLQQALQDFSNTVDTSAAAGYSEQPVAIPASTQRSGDPQKGMDYLLYGDYVNSGIPFDMFQAFFPKDKRNLLHRKGDAANVNYAFNLTTANNGVRVVAPNCLQCHAQEFGDSLVVGMGNSLSDYTINQQMNGQTASMAMAFLKGKKSSDYNAAKNFLTALRAAAPNIVTEVRGVNIAERLTYILLAHRDPQTLVWSDTPMYEIPKAVIPSDVPAWWLLKKKHGMFYTGFGRGDFGKFIMGSNMLTTNNLQEALAVNEHMGDLLAFLLQLKAPAYPNAINTELAAAGKPLFDANCSKCHGTYGEDGQYPNLLVPEHIIQTDSLLYVKNFRYPQMVNWFNQSWLANGDQYKAKLVPFAGYIAPPLDGVWCTAPYLHNGSVPNLATLLNSKARPTYWKRNFTNPVYDYESIGWQYDPKDKAGGKNVYNTELPGYGNQGHYFGDKLNEAERNAVIEYLKTL